MRRLALPALSLFLLPVLVLSSCSPGTGLAGPSDQYRNYYEIFVRSFYDSDGDGIGDLRGVTGKLGYIRDELGCDGIWLMPIMPSPSYHKYDVTDYYEIDPEYGTLDDFKDLLTEAHRRDVKVIIDLVLNHTSDQNPWFKEASESVRTGKENPYRVYYNFTAENKGEGYSNLTENAYYESRFYSGMPDLNLDAPEVRAEILNIARFWLDLGVDGFRLDAVTSFYTGKEAANAAFMQWLSSSLKEIRPDIYLVGEAWTTQVPILEYYTSGLDSFFNFPFSQFSGGIVQNLNAKTGRSLAESVQTWNEKIRQANPTAIDAMFLSNHDNARSAGFLMKNLPKQKLAASLYLLMPGNPFIYYGEEIGLTGSGVDPNKRLPMLWSTEDSAGFCEVPPGSDQTSLEQAPVERQVKDKTSLFSHYKALLAIKQKYPEIARGTFKAIQTANHEVCAFSVTYEEHTVYVFHNLKSSSVTEDLSSLPGSGLRVRETLSADSPGAAKLNGLLLTLPGFSTTILK